MSHEADRPPYAHETWPHYHIPPLPPSHLYAHVTWLHVAAELLVVAVALVEQADTQSDVVAGLLVVAVQLRLAFPCDVLPLLILRGWGGGDKGMVVIVG